MLKFCEPNASNHDIVFNPGKTRCYNSNASLGSVRVMKNDLTFTDACALFGINVLLNLNH